MTRHPRDVFANRTFLHFPKRTTPASPTRAVTTSTVSAPAPQRVVMAVVVAPKKAGRGSHHHSRGGSRPVCRFFLIPRGCRAGSACRFAHDEAAAVQQGRSQCLKWRVCHGWSPRPGGYCGRCYAQLSPEEFDGCMRDRRRRESEARNNQPRHSSSRRATSPLKPTVVTCSATKSPVKEAADIEWYPALLNWTDDYNVTWRYCNAAIRTVDGTRSRCDESWPLPCRQTARFGAAAPTRCARHSHL
jgi:hypothetical protein